MSIVTKFGCAILAVLAFSIQAEERPDHFAGESVANLSDALNSLQRNNVKLDELVKGELTPEKMAQIHELTYSIENAVEMLRNTAKVAADHLERVHLGSESMKSSHVRNNAAVYLDMMAPFTAHHSGDNQQ